ncbi:BTAD domain-containing putative transcriptional regulator [Streptomyces murinus]|uniref:BTAD domain-containing putative transcriptional regulator n=1 Tax=Streptomyces murinus TaxID=33900 RepID=UPI003726918E
MGRKENPIVSPNRELVALAQWLRDQRSASGHSYAQLAVLARCHATTLQRAASARAVPSARSVRAYARACGASEKKAMELWLKARRRNFRTPGGSPPDALGIDGVEALRAGLRRLYELAGRPPVREMEERAGTGRLPHSTAHRIVGGRTVPRDIHQLTGFLTACSVAAAEHPLWIDAWRRALGRDTPSPPAPRTAGAVGPVVRGGVEAAGSVTPDRQVPEPLGASAGLRFALLGPVRAWYDGRQLRLGSPQQRAVAAALLLREGRTATAGELIDAVWGEEPPPQALAALRTYVSRLRGELRREAGDALLVSESGGYTVRLPERRLDLTCAKELCVRAEQARAAGDLPRARAVVREVLGLWDGEALAGVPGPYAAAQRVRLEEWRLHLLESCLDMDLALGRHAEAVAELTALTAAHPLRERLRELLMLALYRSGRQAEALAVYADTRRLLAEELGVDPRSGLRELQQRILRADPALHEPAAPRPAERGEVRVRPAQLPVCVADFTGRTEVTARLVGLLSAAGRTDVPVAALWGTGGVGKSALAVRVGQAVRRFFPDGQLYVDLQQEEPAGALGAALRALGVAGRDVPEGLAERAALYRSVLDGRRVLVVADHARDAAQVRWLLPASAGCGVLVTSRRRMLGLAGARLVELDAMSPQEALALFTRVVGERRVAAERAAARYVVAACGFLPLAVRAAACRLAARPAWTVAMLAGRLADESGRLAELEAGDLAVRPLFENCYTALDGEQARALRVLSGSANPFLSVPAAAGLLGCGPQRAEDALESLVDAGLLIPMGPAHYQVHVLARLFALSLPAP